MFIGSIYLNPTEAPLATYTSYSSFIKHIRGLGFEDFSFFVKISINEIETPLIMISADTVYIVGAYHDGKQQIVEIPKHLIRYDEHDCDIYIHTLIITFQNLFHWVNSSHELNHKDMKLIIFILSEAARFEDVENFVNTLLAGHEFSKIEHSWLNWRPLLKKWNDISKLATHQSQPVKMALGINSRYSMFMMLEEQDPPAMTAELRRKIEEIKSKAEEWPTPPSSPKSF